MTTPSRGVAESDPLVEINVEQHHGVVPTGSQLEPPPALHAGPVMTLWSEQ
jgi:hypothetical protein